MKQVGSDRIVWTDSSIDDLRRKLDTHEIDDYEYQGEDDEEIAEIVDGEDFIPSDDEVVGDPDPIFVGVPPAVYDIDFPWPILVSQSSFVVSGMKTTGVDTTLSWEDVVDADDYEVRISGA